MSFIKTMFFLSLLTLLIIGVGWAVGGNNGALVALLAAVLVNFFSYWFSDKIILRIYRAKPLSSDQYTNVYEIVSHLAARANIPMPKLYIIEQQQPNAFATGRNPKHAAVVVTRGILNILDDNELEGVLGHELSHIKHRDILLGSLVAVLVGAISFMVRFAFWGRRGRNSNIVIMLIALIAAPIAALLLQMAISRTREYKADKGSAQLTGKPIYLENALTKISWGVSDYKFNINPSSSHLFIANPLKAGGIAKLFSTHPPIKERIKRLREME